MTDAIPAGATDESCGCCRPPAKTSQDVVNELLARRAAVDERLHRLEPAVTGLRGPNAVTGLRGPNAVTGLRGPNAVTGLRGPNAIAGAAT